MKVVTSHVGCDFDALASMVAAAKLHEGAIPCFSGAAGRNVREYLRRFDFWKIRTPGKINMDAITTLVAVDVRSRNRIGPFREVAERPGVDVVVYDHHPPVSDPLVAREEYIEPVGATVTLMVELLTSRGIPISPAEATLFSLGIYEDTGMFTFAGATRRDFAAAALLRERGADGPLVGSFVDFSLNSEERGLMEALVAGARERYIHGARVVLASARCAGYVEGVSLFVHRIRDAFDADVAVAVVSMGQRMYVVVRSREHVLDAAQFLEPLGGGGHAQAASASLAGDDVDHTLRSLEKQLEHLLESVLRVRDVMSSPVLAVSPATTVEEAVRLMLRYGHSALPLVRDDALVGVVTRKDLDKALLHGFGVAAVGEFMTENPWVVFPDAPVAEAHRLLVQGNIGRLPVLERGGLVGIITRTDVLRALYPTSLMGSEQPPVRGRVWEEDVGPLLQRHLSKEAYDLLERLGRRGAEMRLRVYAVGGFVRDLLLGAPGLDLDVVVEGDAVAFLESWRGDGCRVAVHPRFATGTVIFPDGQKVDVATARREFYEYPSAQPRVASDSLKHDLYRRDYSVNAMAVALNPEIWGTLVDYFGGRRDLRYHTLRVLHNLSFVEDPTRVFRGVRLEQRLGFRLEDTTLRLLKTCVQSGMLGMLSGVRLRSEVELLLQEEHPLKAVRRLTSLGAWEMVFSGFSFGLRGSFAMRRLSALWRLTKEDLPDFGRDRWLIFLGALLEECSPAGRRNVPDRLSLTPGERGVLGRIMTGREEAERRLGGSGDLPPSALWKAWHREPPAALFFWGATSGNWRFRRRVLLYLTRWIGVRPMLVGQDLLDGGVPKGPAVGAFLEGLIMARLDGGVETREDELEWVEREKARLDRGEAPRQKKGGQKKLG
ncbi:MAG TPA: CBS domain-containing protein [Synergistaceae bacterium]|nr:CBS domain-containing protein [Synergistaceae bacterium]